MNSHINTTIQSGFTLIELLITMAIAAILLAVATPSFQEMLLNNKTSSYASDFKMALYLAQNEAIKRGVQVTIKPKSNASQVWTGGWDIFEDPNSNKTLDSTEEHIKTYIPQDSSFSLKSASAGFGQWIVFSNTGIPQTEGEFRLCRPDSNTHLSQTIALTYAGNIMQKKGTTSCP